jgi:crotonobetainyl-CoA:carnitine CoA-transferase CaiB-like acyl-CoA transferase
MAHFCPTLYGELHEGVTVERLDLKSRDGAARMREILSRADLFLASQRPSALKRLGLDAETLLATDSPLNHLRWLNIVGEREHPEVPGHDLTYLAKAGLLGRESPKALFADVLTAENAFATALLLLRQPQGSRAEVGLYDSLAPLVAMRKHGLTGPGTLLGGKLPAYGIYDTREGRIAVAALEPHFRQRLYEALHLAPGADLADVFTMRTASEWEAWASALDLPIAKVASTGSVPDSA